MSDIYRAKTDIKFCVKLYKSAGQVVCMGEMRNAYKILVRKSDGKRARGKSNVDGRIILE
jgi:hypothetical protein